MDPKEYIEDAAPCKQCGVVPTDRVEEAPAATLCGIAVGGARIGTVLRCPKCNKHTGAYPCPGEAYYEWNEIINKESTMTLDELKYANIQMEAANELAKQADEFDKTAGLLQIALNRNEPGQPFVKKIAKMMFRFYNRKNKKGQAEAGLLWFRDLETERCGHDIMVDERVLECLRDHFKMRRDELIAELQNITIGGNLNES